MKTKIEWTDATWNPVRGCTKISPGCKHCYAETLSERFRGVPGHPYEQGFDLRLVPEKLEEPLRRRQPKTAIAIDLKEFSRLRRWLPVPSTPDPRRTEGRRRSHDQPLPH